MIASDEIIVPQAGHAVSDSTPEFDSAWTTTFATGFATGAMATGICGAGFVAAAGAGLDGMGWGLSPPGAAEATGTGFAATGETAMGVAGIDFIACSWASN